MQEYTTVREQVEYGLDKIAEDRTIEVSLRDLMYVYKTLGEFVRFFHQPMHYPTLAHVKEFLGTVDEGAAQVLTECYYEKLSLYYKGPKDIKDMIDESEFDHPLPPHYYKPTDED
ncbi:hypothetical protein EON80_01010 [bacterium]|nr:MAG: hypothetical protein EON80_01010 [bacterium]